MSNNPVAYVDYPVAYVEYPVALLMEISFWAKTGRRGSSWTFSIMNPHQFFAVLTFTENNKHINSQKHIYIIKMARTLGQFVPMPVIRLFNQTPGYEKRDFYIKLPIYRPSGRYVYT